MFTPPEAPCRGRAARRKGKRLPHGRVRTLTTLVILTCAAGPVPAAAQHARKWFSGSAEAVLALTRSDPIPLSSDTIEFSVEQAMVMLSAGTRSGRLSARATVNLEGWTIPNGVLTVGGWGEGFNDRRHPHTYVHELMLSGTDVLGSVDGDASVSVSAGKGFVAFGTDDPMSRPALRYPVNHHWSQILERVVVIVGVRAGAVAVEGTVFNGDEPERPGQWPRIAGRFGDSWATRLTVWPVPWLEVQGSRAHVHSPEHRPGAGTDQRKWSASLRVERPLGSGRLYGLAEWARTTEADGFFEFSSLLAEAAWAARTQRLYYRIERTDRPEEERQLNPFRSVRPHLENSIVGVTRWTIHTAGYSMGARALGGWAWLEPLVELSHATAADVGGGAFDTRSFYGRTTFWSVTAGIRLRVPGTPPHRMGRYGVLILAPARAHTRKGVR